MAIVQNGTNKYIDHPIIVDAAGSTPFATVAAGITAAVGLGVTTTTVFIKAGTYTENLTLVNGINLEGEDPYTTIIDGVHTVPAAGQIQISNLKLAQTTPATNLFIEGGAGTCAIDIIDCIFYIDSGMAFNLVASTGPISVKNCQDISTANSIIDNTTGLSALTILNSYIGTGAVAAAIAGTTIVENSTMSCPLDIQKTSASQIHHSTINAKVTTIDTATVQIDHTNIYSGAVAALDIGVGTVVTASNIVIDSTVAGGNSVIGLGSITLAEVTFVNALGITTTTQDYTTRAVSGSLQLDTTTCVGALYGAAGVVTSTAAMTNGQVLVGSTGVAPALATITAGAGIAVTNGAGSISVASTAPFTWAQVGADGALVVNQGSIDTKAGLLTMSLPAASAVGDTMILQGYGAGGWTITQGAGQQILVGNTNTTLGAGGTLSSTDKGDSVSMVCTTANLEWRVFGMVGNLTVV